MGLKVALPVLIVVAAAWAVRESNPPVSQRIEKLGQAWGALDQRVAEHRRYLLQTPPTAPNYQAKIQQELGFISRESSRIISELNPFLTPPNERTRLAQFLTAELAKTLNLSSPERVALLAYVQNRLVQGTTLREAEKTIAETAPTEAAEIRATLSPAQQQAFDDIYGADGVMLFSYAKAVAVGTIGP